MSEKENDNGIIELEDIRKNAEDRKLRAKRIAKKASSVRNKNKAPVSRTILIVGVILILMLVYVIADLASGGFLFTVNGKFVSALTRNASEKFFAATDADNVYSFTAYDNGYVILTENGISYVDSDGDETSRQQLTYSNPSLDISGSRILVFDRGNTSYSLFRSDALYSQMTTSENILDAAVCSRDNYAIAVKDENAKCILYGFDGNGNIIYQWNCPDGYIADIAMNSSGSKVAVTVINSVNAVLSSKIYILDFEYDSAYAEFDYPDEIVIGSEFISGRKIQVITDENVYLISGRNQEAVYSYGSADICYSSISEARYTAVVTNNHTHDDYYTLVIFGAAGNLRCAVDITGNVMDVSASDKSICVLFENKTETYSGRGKLVGTTSDINYNDEIIINGNYIFVLSSDSVKRFSAYGSSSAVYSYEDETF